jgi:hypothetical protein
MQIGINTITNQLKKTNAMKTLINKTEQLKMDKGIHRELMMEMGMYNIHKEKSYKDKSKYTRKEKHKKGYE